MKNFQKEKEKRKGKFYTVADRRTWARLVGSQGAYFVWAMLCLEVQYFSGVHTDRNPTPPPYRSHQIALEGPSWQRERYAGVSGVWINVKAARLLWQPARASLRLTVPSRWGDVARELSTVMLQA